jgi:hypothetical protein
LEAQYLNNEKFRDMKKNGKEEIIKYFKNILQTRSYRLQNQIARKKGAREKEEDKDLNGFQVLSMLIENNAF